jgi:hypothetical protein
MSTLAPDPQSGIPGAALSADVFAALEWLIERCMNQGLTLRTTLAGDELLIEAISLYGRIEPDDETLIALSASPHTVSSEIARLRPETVYTLARGPLWSALAPIRPGLYPLNSDLPRGRWAEFGYVRTAQQGFLGPDALLLILSERLCRALGRPNLADRCRIAAQRSNDAVPVASAVVVRTYQAVQP